MVMWSKIVGDFSFYIYYIPISNWRRHWLCWGATN